MSQLIMEADADQFKVNEVYYTSMPRPTRHEEQGLDLNLIERGQFEPIKVRKDMTILDGYTRWQLLGDRGVKIKYEFREFNTPEDELNYVVECNVMKRNLTDYQKVEAMLKLFGEQRFRRNVDEHKRQYIDILNAIDKGNIIPRTIAGYIGRELSSVNRLLKQMTDKYYTSSKANKRANLPNEYSLMPKGKGLLESNPMTKTIKEIGKDIGVDRNMVSKAIYLIDNANKKMKLQLINDTLTIGQAYRQIMGKEIKKYPRVNHNTKLKCPNCDAIHAKKDFEIVR